MKRNKKKINKTANREGIKLEEKMKKIKQKKLNIRANRRMEYERNLKRMETG